MGWWMILLLGCGGRPVVDGSDTAAAADSTSSTAPVATGSPTTGSPADTSTSPTDSAATEDSVGPCGPPLTVEVGLEDATFAPVSEGAAVPITLAHDGAFEVRLAARVHESATPEVRLVPTVTRSDGAVLAGAGELDAQYVALVMESDCTGVVMPLRAFLDDQPLSVEDVCALAGEPLTIEVSVLDATGHEARVTVELVGAPRPPGGC